MAHEFRLPDIGEGLTEATIVHWYVEVGEVVGLDAPLVEVETDKAVVDIPAPHAGVLLHRGAGEGDTLQVERLLAVIGEEGETWADDDGPGDQPTAPQAAAPIVGRLEEAPEAPSPSRTQAQMLPAVRRLAGELGVDLDTVVGTGPEGRVTEDDVRGAAAAATEGTGPVRRVAMSPLRRTIAANLARSWREIPHVTTYGEADATAVLAERDAAADEAGKPPLEAVLIRRFLPLLKEHPDFNASVVGTEIIQRLHYDIGFAVDTPDGLMVAVIADAPSHGLAGLAAEVRRLAEAARSRTATGDELRGQTFTVSNIGAVGGRFGTPIVPYGTTAILSVGRADPRPVVRDGEIVIGRELPLSLSYDHRAIDGAAGRAFMAAVVDAFEAPA